MKHDILFSKGSKIVKSKFYETSYEVFRKFILEYDITQHLLESDIQIQFDWFYEPVFLADYDDRSFTAFPVDDLASLLVTKHAAERFKAIGFELYYQEDNKRISYSDPLKLFNRLIEPLEAQIMNKRLTIFGE